MLGHRGCRLGITYPEIYEMQTRAIVEAVVEVEARTGVKSKPEIMVPLVAIEKELEVLRQLVLNVISHVEEERGCKLDILIGTMIELPRAALQASNIAQYAEFFSFGTNDLTQTVFGISRDDSTQFLGDYVRQGILAEDPFVSLDHTGVGELIKIAIERGRRTRPNIKLGICGEHGGDPKSVEFCHSVGLDYVSCSPYRVPIARLAAAQAVLREQVG
jgi:pyruvate,orthophosphate dikinase